MLLVDIDGARGQEMWTIKERYPQSPRRSILQDLPDTIKRVQPIPGMEIMHCNFYMIQQSKVSQRCNF